MSSLATPTNILSKLPPDLLFMLFGPVAPFNDLVLLPKPTCGIMVAQGDGAVTQVIISFQPLPGSSINALAPGQYAGLNLIFNANRQFIKFSKPISQFYLSAITGGSGLFTLAVGGIDEIDLIA